MRKLIASMNMTLDGFCDHTSMTADDEIHEHYSELLRNADTLVFGRKTYQLMEDAWPAIVKNPTGNKPADDFAVTIDQIQKLVFSHTLKNVAWRNTRLAKKDIAEEITSLKQSPGGNILVGSPSTIVATLNLGLADELQLNVQPTIAGSGLRLFKDINQRIDLQLMNTKNFRCGAITFYYHPVKK